MVGFREGIVRKVWAFIWIGTLGAVLGHLAWTAGSLPDYLAVHFDVVGRPNGFQGKASFLESFIFFVLFINGLFGLACFWMGRLPENLIHIPRKDYWFSTPERKAIALGKITGIFLLIGAFSNVAFLFAVQVIYQENAKNPIRDCPWAEGPFSWPGLWHWPSSAFLFSGSLRRIGESPEAVPLARSTSYEAPRFKIDSFF